MKKLFVIIGLIFINFFFSQTVIKVDSFEFYYGYKDFLEDKPVKSNVKGEITVISSKIFKVGTFRYKETDKRAKPENFTWAIKYNNDIYFSMMNAAYIYSDYFVKTDIIGKKYWVIFLNEKTDRIAIGSNNPYGGGIVGAVLNMKPKNSWKDKNGNSYKILLIDFENPNIERSRPKDNNAYLVDKNKIIDLTKNDPITIQKLKDEKYTIEDFVEFIKANNK